VVGLQTVVRVEVADPAPDEREMVSEPGGPVEHLRADPERVTLEAAERRIHSLVLGELLIGVDVETETESTREILIHR